MVTTQVPMGTWVVTFRTPMMVTLLAGFEAEGSSPAQRLQILAREPAQSHNDGRTSGRHGTLTSRGPSPCPPPDWSLTPSARTLGAGREQAGSLHPRALYLLLCERGRMLPWIRRPPRPAPPGIRRVQLGHGDAIAGCEAWITVLYCTLQVYPRLNLIRELHEMTLISLLLGNL